MDAFNTFTTLKYSNQSPAASLFLKFVDVLFFMKVESDVDKDANFIKMSFPTVKVLTKRTVFVFSSFIYLLVGSEG